MLEPSAAPSIIPSPYAAFDVVGVVASTGGLAAVTGVLGALPSDFPAAVVLVLHRATGWGDGTAAILARRTVLRVKAIDEGEPLRPGTVYVAPPDRQAYLDCESRLSLGRAQRCRADDVFASLATAFGERVIGVILTGRLDDGAAGARAIKSRGGRVLAQDGTTSEQFAMPSAAASTGCVDWVLPLGRIGPALVSLVMWPGAAELLRVPTPPWATLGA
jgi:two-component system chemotaxis response regulator CheB